MSVSGNLRAGQQIPSTRALASDLKISAIPVLTAYAQLLAEGYFETLVGSGTFVCRSLPEQTPRTERGPARSIQVRSGSRLVARRAMLHPRYPTSPRLGLGAFRPSPLAYDQLPVPIW